MKPFHYVLCVFGAFILFLVLSAASTYNFGNRAEVGLKAKFQDLEQHMSNGMQQVAGRVQVADMYAEDRAKFTSLYADAIMPSGGDREISNLVMFLQAKAPDVPDTLYRDIGREISATKEEMKNLNSAAIRQKAQYEEALGSLYQGTMLRLMGFPRMDLDMTFKIPVIAAAKKAYQTGVEEDIQLRKK